MVLKSKELVPASRRPLARQRASASGRVLYAFETGCRVLVSLQQLCRFGAQPAHDLYDAPRRIVDLFFSGESAYRETQARVG